MRVVVGPGGMATGVAAGATDAARVTVRSLERATPIRFLMSIARTRYSIPGLSGAPSDTTRLRCGAGFDGRALVGTGVTSVDANVESRAGGATDTTRT